MKLTIKTQRQLRDTFWDTFSESIGRHYRATKRQNDYPADIRMAWVDFVDSQRRSGVISTDLASRVTL